MKSSCNRLSIAIAQLNPTIGDLAGNAQQILAAAEQAAAQGARLLLTPELSLCGYPPRDLLLNTSFVERMATSLQQLARDLPAQLAVLVGTVEHNARSQETGGKPLFNSIALLEAGKVQQIFHKRLLPTYDVFDEHRYFEPGKQSNAFTLTLSPPEAALTENSAATDQPLPSVRIGVTICEDLWNDEEFWGKRHYPENPIADLAQQGTDLIVNLSASPYSIGKQKLRESMLQHCSQRYQQPVLYANQVGGNDDLIFDGSSIAFDRQGTLVGRARAFETGLLRLEFDLVQRTLRGLDLVKSADSVKPADSVMPLATERILRDTAIGQPIFDSATTLQTKSAIAPSPNSEEAEIWSALVLGVRDYARKCGFSQAVIGLSGGIDSALVAAIATAALGAKNVLGVLMPSPYSSEHSIQDALALAKNLGITTHTLPIEALMQGYDRTLHALFASTPPGIAEENIQSRIRGNLLMAIANKFGHLLLSTGNKSEMSVGYCTLYGDMNGGLAVIADVPKTRVYSLCRWLNRQNPSPQDFPPQDSLSQDRSQAPSPCFFIPTHILTKAPSAELKEDQYDSDSLPDYDILDDILDKLIEKHQSPAQIVDAGHNAAIVDKIARLVARTEFKRRQAPPGLKITDRAFGTGWRMPIACKGLSLKSASQ